MFVAIIKQRSGYKRYQEKIAEQILERSGRQDFRLKKACIAKDKAPQWRSWGSSLPRYRRSTIDIEVSDGDDDDQKGEMQRKKATDKGMNRRTIRKKGGQMKRRQRKWKKKATPQPVARGPAHRCWPCESTCKMGLWLLLTFLISSDK